MAVKGYDDLIVWQRAMDLVEAVYKCSEQFPRKEMFGLTSQVRRAAVAIPSNIAEGQGRRTTRDFLHFLSIARGSLQDVETQILVGRRLNYINDEQNSTILSLVAEIGRLINALIGSLERRALDTSH
jgi:four helix bundle protein